MRQIAPLPAIWQQEFADLQQQYRGALDAEQCVVFDALCVLPAFLHELACVWLGSRFAFDWCLREPGWLLALFDAGPAQHAPVDVQLEADKLASLLAVQCVLLDDENELLRVLRRFRQQTMLRIIWRDITRRATTLQTTAALSALADVCIRQAVDFLYPRLCAECGTPLSAAGVPQQLLVLGMGKLGAFELNLSSDIDLIFAYDESGETHGARQTMANRDFFRKLGQKLINALDKTTADGFVFRVDMRLRPYGDSGALALNYDAMEQYYQQQGRDWERYAMIKARLICGDEKQAAPLLDMLRHFTFRRYLDFASIASLRDLKRQIEREVSRKGMAENIKLGAGGIREIEFIVQSFQLIHGGRYRELQPAPVIPMLQQLQGKGLLTADDTQQLQEAYFFLRDVEHLLQAWRDEQTQMLPHDDTQQARLAWLMGFSDWQDFYAALQGHRRHVQDIFAALIAPPQPEHEGEQNNIWQALWEGMDDVAAETAALTTAGCTDADVLQALLSDWRSDKQLLTLPGESRERLSRFMPLLLQALSAYEKSADILSRLLPLLRAVLRRSSYLVLLIENPQALKQLVLLADASSWIAEQLAAWPVLLDELIDLRNLYRDVAPSRDELVSLLRQQLLRIPDDDLEAQMETLRHFKRAHSLRAAACEVTGRLPLMKVSDYLTFMAEAILAQVLQMVWQPLVAKHGVPLRADGSPCDPGFIIVGYGKLGGLELGHGSDLDLVFIHAAGSGETQADTATGQVAIENSVFFARLGQKIIHILGTRTINGVLYEVDMRLRPSGNSGLLVASLASFARYQEKDAWTWEHQALTRARVVAGCPQLAREYEAVRAHVLGQRRDVTALAREVTEMRAKMRAQLDHSDDAHFDLKHGYGGIVDLEFLVQFLVLARGCDHPNLLVWTDNIRILEQAAVSELLPVADTESLMEAYRRLRARGHRRVLHGESTLIAADELLDERKQITQAWQYLIGQYLSE